MPKGRQARESAFYHPIRDCLQLFRGSEKKSSGGREPDPVRARLLARTAGTKKLCSAKRKRLGDERGARTLKGAGSTPPIGKELPMEFTASVTAILAIMSFGFLAAVILGMI
jgi:hypothetical protein